MLYLLLQGRKKTPSEIMKKIQKARLVIESMIFLGIPTEQFMEMKKQHGGLDGLYNWIESQIS